MGLLESGKVPPPTGTLATPLSSIHCGEPVLYSTMIRNARDSPLDFACSMTRSTSAKLYSPSTGSRSAQDQRKYATVWRGISSGGGGCPKPKWKSTNPLPGLYRMSWISLGCTGTTGPQSGTLAPGAVPAMLPKLESIGTPDSPDSIVHRSKPKIMGTARVHPFRFIMRSYFSPCFVRATRQKEDATLRYFRARHASGEGVNSRIAS